MELLDLWASKFSGKVFVFVSWCHRTHFNLGNVKLPNKTYRWHFRGSRTKGTSNNLCYLFYQTKQNTTQPTWQSRQNTCIHMDKSQIEPMQTSKIHKLQYAIYMAKICHFRPKKLKYHLQIQNYHSHVCVFYTFIKHPVLNSEWCFPRRKKGRGRKRKTTRTAGFQQQNCFKSWNLS